MRMIKARYWPLADGYQRCIQCSILDHRRRFSQRKVSPCLYTGEWSAVSGERAIILRHRFHERMQVLKRMFFRKRRVQMWGLRVKIDVMPVNKYVGVSLLACEFGRENIWRGERTAKTSLLP